MNAQEEWRTVEGFPRYEVSNLGRIRSYVSHRRKKIIVKPWKINSGYLSIRLNEKETRKGFLVHRLVASCFIGKCPVGYFVNHKDENRMNNRADNLEYLTPKENINYGSAIDKIRESRSIKVVASFPDGTEIVFPSMQFASLKLGHKKSNEISRHILGTRTSFTVHGAKWRYA